MIVLVGPAYPLRGGIAHFNESFARELVSQGYRVKLVSFTLQYPSVLFPGKTQKAIADPPRDLEIYEMINSVNPLSWRLAAKKILKWQPQLVVVRFWIPFMGPSLGTLARRVRRKGVKVVGMVDNAIPHESRPLDRPLSKYFFRHCDAFFTLSEAVAEDIGQLAPGKPVDTSPHPIYDLFGTKPAKTEAIEKLSLDPGSEYILFFGFVRRYKGLDLLLEGFASVLKDLPEVKLIVAGEFYDEKQPYLDLLGELNLGDRVVIMDEYIPEEDVKYYFAAASLVAQPYRTATQSGVTQIAYHFDRPMLVTDVGGLAEIVPDGKAGFVVKPEPEAIGTAIARFFREDREEEFAKNVQKEKVRFSWDHFTSRFLSFVNKINAD